MKKNKTEKRKKYLKKSQKTTLGYYWKFGKNYKKSYFLKFFAMSISTLTGFVLVPFFFKKLIDIMTEANSLNKMDYWPDLLIIFGFFIAAHFATVLFRRIFDFAHIYFQVSLLRDLEKFCFEKLQDHSYDFFSNNFVGSLVSKVHRFYRSAERIDDISNFKIYPNVIGFSVSIAIIFFFTPKVAIIIAAWLILFFSGVYFLVKKFQLPLDQKNATAQSETTAALADPITNAITTKMFARKKYENSRFSSAVDKMFRVRKKAWYMHNNIDIFQAVMILFINMAVLYLVLKMWVAGAILLGTVVLIQMYLGQIYRNLWEFGSVIKDWNQSMADAKEMTDILNQEIEIKDPKKPEKCKISRGRIDFENVAFSYGIKNKSNVFKNFNLKIKAGERVGLVGESGAGKSTITKLLLRFSDINQGKITIDGQSITKITQDDLRSKIAFVPQEAILFHRSLLENIRYGDLKANDKTVFAVAKKANAHEFISEKPKGYKTLVGERGIKLSGGEKQRVAIARAMLKNTPILILDEATASLDSKSEKLIQDALEKLMRERTTIVIAHRLSTLQKMDRILVLDNGNIIEEGSHKFLLRKNGKYAQLWKHQTGGYFE